MTRSEPTTRTWPTSTMATEVDGQPEIASSSAMAAFESAGAPRSLLPSARIGRASRGAGGILARLWDWIRLPRVKRFRCCARCGLTLDADRSGVGTYCYGWIGGPYQRCCTSTYRYG